LLTRRRGAAICTLEKRIFGVFAVLFDTRVMFDPDRISHFLSRGGQVNVSEDVVVLPYITPELSFVFADPAQLQKPVETLKALVNEVDKEVHLRRSRRKITTHEDTHLQTHALFLHAFSFTLAHCALSFQSL
jgi:hypothetical protein